MMELAIGMNGLGMNGLYIVFRAAAKVEKLH